MNSNSLHLLPIEPIELTKEEKASLENIMRIGNLRLEHWHNLLKEEYKLGRKFSRFKLGSELVRGLKNQTTKIPLDYTVPNSKKIIAIPYEDLVKINEVEQVRSKIMSGYIRIVSTVAARWNKRSNDVSLSLSDLISEGVKILLNCTHCYTQSTQFSTYAYSSVERRITLVCTRTSPLSEKTERASKLLREFKKVKISFNGPCNFDEVCDKMGINYEDRILLEKMQIGVVGGLTAEGKDKLSTDYSVRALNFGNNYSVVAHQNGVGNTIRGNNNEMSEINYEMIVQEANLTEFEAAVLKAWMESPDDRWRADFAENYISPVSGNKVTRQRIAQVANDVAKKIRRVLVKYNDSEAA